LFPPTQWSVVLAGGAKRDEAALARLCRLFWYPLYAYACPWHEIAFTRSPELQVKELVIKLRPL
jgi:hypothetical protein